MGRVASTPFSGAVFHSSLNQMNGFLFYTAAFLVMLGVLVFVHELGHFLVARWCGVKVLRFSIGFGQTLWSKPFGRDRTEWSVGLIPLGGFVKMLDESEGEVAPDEAHRAFNRQKVWRRMAIVAAGPLTNLLLAVFIYWGGFWHGVEELRPVLGAPVAASPAARAGIENGEKVLKIDGSPVQSWQEVRWKMLSLAADKDWVELEVINPRHEISLRRLELAQIRESGWEGDALEHLGLRYFRPKIPPLIGKITPDGSADRAGLLAGDEILEVNGEAIDSWHQVVLAVRASPEKPMRFGISRQGRFFELSLTPTRVKDGAQEIGRIGATVRDPGFKRDDLVVVVRYDPLTALGKALDETWDKTVFSLRMIGKMLTGEVSWQNISGPVTIADYAGQSAKSGANPYLKFMALVSISLGVLNLLPVPILDGGHLLYYVAEIIRGKPLSERWMEIGQKIGMFLLGLLMICAFYNDINRLISG